MIKNSKGITLIALVVTIIVIIILSGITLNMTIGNNGIVTKTQESKRNELIAEQEGQNKIDELKAAPKDSSTGVKNPTNDTTAPIINEIKVADITGNSFRVNVNVTEQESQIISIGYTIKELYGENYQTDPVDPTAKSYEFTGLDLHTTYTVEVKVTTNNSNATLASSTASIQVYTENSTNN